jgi:hypothetical protein
MVFLAFRITDDWLAFPSPACTGWRDIEAAGYAFG